MQKVIKSMTGYKATDKDMRCQWFQFELGKWYEHEGELSLCNSGFHFCQYPSGPWTYYSDKETRIFKIEAEDVLDLPVEPGADYKLVCRKIRLVEEVKIGGEKNTGYRNTGDSNTGDRNTGYRNTGDSNTGDRNTGYRNTGDSNTGDRNTGYSNTGYRNTGDSNTGYSNTGYRNTGDRNTGYRNTGYSNTGDSNTGDSNTGDRNTGYSNTGYSNTGDSNTGDRNTGNGNASNYHSGHFNIKPAKVICFDVQTKYTHEQFRAKYGDLMDELSEALISADQISYGRFKKLPGITKKKLEKLHKAHIEKRRTPND